MNKQQRYLGMGMVGATAVILFIRALYAFGSDINFWIVVFAGTATGMMYLVFDIFRATKKITTAPLHTSRENKKP